MSSSWRYSPAIPGLPAGWPLAVVVVAATDQNVPLIEHLVASGVVLAPTSQDPNIAIPDMRGPGTAAGPRRPSAPAGMPSPARDEPDTPEAPMIDAAAHAILWRGHKLALTEQEFALLARLLQPAGRAHTFAELGRDVWGIAEHFDAVLVHSAMRRLRRKLAAAGVAVDIESVRGYGFRLARRATGPAPAPVPDGGPDGGPEGGPEGGPDDAAPSSEF